MTGSLKTSGLTCEIYVFRAPLGRQDAKPSETRQHVARNVQHGAVGAIGSRNGQTVETLVRLFRVFQAVDEMPNACPQQ